MSCKHCQAARDALLKAKIMEAGGHVVKAIAAKVKPKKSRRVSRSTQPEEGNLNAQE